MASLLNWADIDTVLLDMDGTLLDLHFDNYFWLHYVPEVYSQTHDIAHDVAVHQLHKRFQEEQGKMAWYCLDYWTEELNVNIAELKRNIRHKIQIRPAAQPFLQALAKARQDVVLLTNAHRDSLDLKMEETGIDHYFDHIISTHDYGVPKEEQALWRQLKADLDFDPARTLLIDDTESVLDSAKLFGIQHLLGIVKPDSMREGRSDLKYPAIDHFEEIMPDE